MEFEAYLDTPTRAAELAFTDVRVFADNGAESTRADAALAIDAKLETSSCLAAGFTQGDQRALFDFGGLKAVNRLRAAKIGDIDALPGSDVMDLVVLYSSDSGPLRDRTYHAVSGLQNGYLGLELIKAATVNADGRIENDTHDFAADGWYSLTFDVVNATALALHLHRDAADPFPYVY
jgi:hypothetical protein